MVELNQLGSIGLSDNNNLFVHKDPISYGKDKNVERIINDLTERFKSNLFIISLIMF